jgi:hypothetical protein
LLPLAIEYGMSPEQFWLEDMSLFNVYQKAYYRKIHNQAFVQAQYFNYALSVQLSNMWLKKGQKPLQFLDKPFDPFEKQIKKDDLQKDYEYRQALLQWI